MTLIWPNHYCCPNCAQPNYVSTDYQIVPKLYPCLIAGFQSLVQTVTSTDASTWKGVEVRMTVYVDGYVRCWLFFPKCPSCSPIQKAKKFCMLVKSAFLLVVLRSLTTFSFLGWIGYFIFYIICKNDIIYAYISDFSRAFRYYIERGKTEFNTQLCDEDNIWNIMITNF